MGKSCCAGFFRRGIPDTNRALTLTGYMINRIFEVKMRTASFDKLS